MSLADFFKEGSIVLEVLKGGGITIGVIILSLIKIPRININIWGILGRAINKEQKEQTDKLQKSVDELSKQLEEFIKNESEYRANESRRDILAFNDEILRNVKHSKERFDDVLHSIDDYEDYCENHPLYANNKAVLAIQNIKKVYQNCLTQQDFL